MLKIEAVWRHLLFQTIEEKNPYFTISKLRDYFSMSSSVISHALSPLRQMSIVEIGKRRSYVRDWEKLLYFWATRRKLAKDIIYSTYNTLPVLEREASLPPKVIPTAYTAARLFYKETPSDYDNIYVYAYSLAELKKRFPPVPKKEPDLFILKTDPFLKKYKQIPLAQILVDLWNLPEWYAKEFFQSMMSKISA